MAQYTAEIQKAARVIKEADAFLFTCGAGMGVDSGLPDFRYALHNQHPKLRTTQLQQT